MKGIYLNGEPLDLEESIDFKVIDESFEFHYIYHPPQKKLRKTYLRNSKVRHVCKELYLAELNKKGYLKR